MTAPEELLGIAEEVARAAGRLVVERSVQAGTVGVAATKTSPTDVVTAVDLAAEELIRTELLARRPDDGFVGEEGTGDTGSTGTSGVTWVVDPIDGTVNYLYGIPQFAVSLAARLDDRVLVGVVHNPVSRETFTASAGAGARRDGVPITSSRCTDLAQALVGTGFSYRAEIRAAQAVETGRLLPVVRDVRRLGSAALDLCFVACGRLDAYVERCLQPWDLAAGALIAREAGVRVEGLFGRPAGQRLVVAAPEALFPAFAAALVAAGYDRPDLGL